MAANNNDGINFSINIEPRLMRHFQQQMPNELRKARKNAVEAMGMVWADTAKEITTNEDHIDTGLYVNSIGYVTGSPSEPPIYEIEEEQTSTTLTIGSNVGYAEALEKRYAIFARALDVGQSRMEQVAIHAIRSTLPY